jgi:hypothetical protein
MTGHNEDLVQYRLPEAESFVELIADLIEKTDST